MEVLATNITHKDPNHNNENDIGRCVVLFLSGALILYGAWLWWRVLPSEIAWLVLLLIACMLFSVYGGLVYLNNYLRWNRTTETISVQHETLVIKCHGCIFHRKKEIPLSAIQRIDTYDGRTLWLWSRLPETLRVVYSNSRRYRFGLCMTDAERDALAKKIMDFVNQSHSTSHGSPRSRRGRNRLSEGRRGRLRTLTV